MVVEVELKIRPQPDFEGRLRRVLVRDGLPDRVPFFELFADNEIMAAILGRPVNSIADVIEYQYRLGYDFVKVDVAGFDLPTEGYGFAQDTAPLPHTVRAFHTASMGVIRTWEDFERYPWPKPENIDFSPLEEAARLLPEGMKLIVLRGHQLESPMALMGFEGLSFALADQPDLVEAVFQRVGELELYCYQNCAQMDAVGAMEISDDLGFKSGTLISPAALRRYVFPWYKRFVEATHAAGKPVILHSCGNLEAVMEDIIACGIDAKHSFEDQIMPVTEFKQRYGDRMAALGGLDMDFLCRRTPDEIRARVREIMEVCMPGGGYAFGTGNTVANYVPVENFLAALDEAWKVGSYR